MNFRVDDAYSTEKKEIVCTGTFTIDRFLFADCVSKTLCRSSNAYAIQTILVRPPRPDLLLLLLALPIPPLPPAAALLPLPLQLRPAPAAAPTPARSAAVPTPVRSRCHFNSGPPRYSSNFGPLPINAASPRRHFAPMHYCHTSSTAYKTHRDQVISWAPLMDPMPAACPYCGYQASHLAPEQDFSCLVNASLLRSGQSTDSNSSRESSRSPSTASSLDGLFNGVSEPSWLDEFLEMLYIEDPPTPIDLDVSSTLPDVSSTTPIATQDPTLASLCSHMDALPDTDTEPALATPAASSHLQATFDPRNRVMHKRSETQKRLHTERTRRSGRACRCCFRMHRKSDSRKPCSGCRSGMKLRACIYDGHAPPGDVDNCAVV